MKSLIISIILLFSLFQCMAMESEKREALSNNTDSLQTYHVESGFKLPLTLRLGAEAIPSYVFGTDGWLKGENRRNQPIRSSFAINFRAGFSFSPESREGILYKDLYQGIGFGPNILINDKNLLGNPSSLYIFQGAPFKKIGKRWTLGYEWQFGIAAGWEDDRGDRPDSESVISTLVTAHMGVRLKFAYSLNEYVNLTFALAGTHFSNGNTSWRNSGLNSAGLAVGVEYTPIPTQKKSFIPFASELIKEADRKRWFVDLIAFGAWRKRTVDNIPTKLIAWDGSEFIKNEEVLVPGKFPVFGIQVAPMIRLNRWVAVGGAFDLKWDKSAGLKPYWIEDTFYEEIKFHHVPFLKQVSAGLSAHVELTTPLFAVNGGVGFNIINPAGDKAFYQQLAIKAFLTDNLFLNIGYGLGNFKNPNHLMLGVGVRL